MIVTRSMSSMHRWEDAQNESFLDIDVPLHVLFLYYEKDPERSFSDAVKFFLEWK